jgi:hypothetical protein
MSLKLLVVEPAPEKTAAVYVGFCERARLLFTVGAAGKHISQIKERAN